MVQRKSFSYKQFKTELQKEIHFTITEMSKDWESEIQIIQQRICNIDSDNFYKLHKLRQANLELNSLFGMIDDGKKFQDQFCSFFEGIVKDVAKKDFELESDNLEGFNDASGILFYVVMSAIVKLGETTTELPKTISAMDFLWDEDSTLFQSVIHHSFVEETSRCKGFQVK